MAARRDIVLLFLTRTVRMVAYGSIGVILALYLKEVGLSDNNLGLLLTLTLLGDSAISWAVTRWADTVGRRTMLVSSCLLMVLAGVVYGEVSHPSFAILLAAATIGVLSPSGNEVGPFMALEQSILSELVPPAVRTHVFAWYNLVGYSMTALGALAAGQALDWAEQRYGISDLEGYRAVFLQYGISGVALLLLFLLLTDEVERPNRRRPAKSPEATSTASDPLLAPLLPPGHHSAADTSPTATPQPTAASSAPRPAPAGDPLVDPPLQEEGGVPRHGPHGGADVSSFPITLEAVLTDDGSECPPDSEVDRGSNPRHSFPGEAADTNTTSRTNTHTHTLVGAAAGAPGGPVPAAAPGAAGGSRDVVFTVTVGAGTAAADTAAAAAAAAVGAKGAGGSGGGGGGGGFWGLSARSRGMVVRLSVLFATDSFAGGLVTGTLLSYYFQFKYGVSTAYLGGLLFGANMLAAVSSLLSGYVAARIGLINTMVFTHLPSNVLMLAVPLMPTLRLATAMVFLRFSISQMDVAPRASYVAGIVRPDERTAAMGIMNIAKSLGAAFGPMVTGWLAEKALFSWAFYLCGGLKILYDLALLWSFSHVKPEH